MEKVLELIELRKDELARNRLIAWMKDESVRPTERLGVAPAMLPWIMGFKDVLRHLHVPHPKTDVDRLVNTHCAEDAGHWVWFLNDLEKLGYDLRSWGGTLEEFHHRLWHETNQASWDTTYILLHYAKVAKAHPTLRVVLLEAIEGTFEVFVGPARDLAAQAGLENQLEFFGMRHAGAEEEHELHGVDLHKLPLDGDTQALAIEAVDEIFAQFDRMFTAWHENRAAYPRMGRAVAGTD